jgi:cytoskeletal protein RodZ
MADEQSPLKVLGTCLREAREHKGLSRATLAAQLRMGDEQLQALEMGDQERLPELVFVIAQARRIADALGVDVNPLLGPIKQQGQARKAAPAPLSSSSTAAVSRSQQRARLSPQSYTQSRTTPSSNGAGLRWFGSLALVAGLIAAGAWGWQRAPQLAQQMLPLLPKSSEKPTPRPPAKPASQPARPSEPLTVSATEPSWLSVRSQQGKQLYEGMFSGSRQFPIGTGLQLRAGRPDLVKVNQGETPAKPLGRIDQIRWVSFNAAPPR